MVRRKRDRWSMQAVNASVLVVPTYGQDSVWLVVATFCQISFTYSKIIEIGEGLVFRQVRQNVEEQDF